MRIRQLAQTFDIDPRDLLQKLAAHGDIAVVADNAMSQLTPAEVELVCAHLGYPAIDEALAQSLGLPKHRGSEVFGELRSVLAKPPSEEVFVELCDWLGAREVDPAAIDYAARKIATWPDDVVRPMPRPWADLLLDTGSCTPAQLCTTFRVYGREVRMREMRHFADAPETASLRHIAMTRTRISDYAFEVMLSSPYLSEVRELDLSGNYLTSAIVEVLLASPLMDKVVYLRLSANRIDDGGFHALANSPRLAQLRDIELYDNQPSSDGISALHNSRYLPRQLSHRVPHYDSYDHEWE